MSAAFYYLCALLLLVANCLAWFSNLMLLPGNWFIVGFSALFAWLLPDDQGRGVSWTVVAVLAGLAVLGEIVELIAGMLGAAKAKASWNAQVLAVVGAIAGSVVGGVVGVPIPLVGPIVGAVLGGAAGAFVGAFVGERWRQRRLGESWAVGRAAFVGRLLGTAGKLAIGGIMLVVATLDAFV